MDPLTTPWLVSAIGFALLAVGLHGCVHNTNRRYRGLLLIAGLVVTAGSVIYALRTLDAMTS
jgi:uncharacterized membrane protein YgdD (TMEM256/DUF423 family)